MTAVIRGYWEPPNAVPPKNRLPLIPVTAYTAVPAQKPFPRKTVVISAGDVVCESFSATFTRRHVVLVYFLYSAYDTAQREVSRLVILAARVCLERIATLDHFLAPAIASWGSRVRLSAHFFLPPPPAIVSAYLQSSPKTVHARQSTGRASFVLQRVPEHDGIGVVRSQLFLAARLCLA